MSIYKKYVSYAKILLLDFVDEKM